MRVRVVGDGVAGLCCGRALQAAGHEVSIVGRGLLPPKGATAIVHPFAGRSLRLDDIDDQAWSCAVPFFDELISRGVARQTTMVRPLRGSAGARLLRSFDRDITTWANRWGVRRETHEEWGDALVYDCAFTVDMRAALISLRHDFAAAPDAPFDLEIIAPGAELSRWLGGDDVRVFGGHLGLVDRAVDHTVSVAGLHWAPTIDGRVCVGSTWWEPEEPMTDESARDELTDRLDEQSGWGVAVDEVWRGFRCVYQPDRRPVVGRFAPGRVVAGALGTRGWFWGPLVGREAARAAQNQPIAPALDIARTTLKALSSPTVAG